MTAVRVIQQPTPLERIREALDWAALKGITVDVGEGYGVRDAVVAGERRWIRERTGGWVSPLGAVVLREQPRAFMMPAAAAEAMHMPEPWIEGFLAGSRKVDLDRHWLVGVSAAAALAGYEVGLQVRATLLSAICAKHGQRYSRIGGICPLCDIAASTRDDEWPTHGAEGGS